MGVNEVRIVRMLNANAHYEMKMQIRGPSCTMKIIAADGVFFTSTWTMSVFSMLPATRFELMIQCSSSGSYSLEAEFGETGDMWSQTVLTFVVSGTSTLTTPVSDADLAAIVRPYYLQDLTSATVQDRNEVHFSQGGNTRFLPCSFALGIGQNCSRVWEGLDQPDTTSKLCPFAEFPGSQGGTGYASSPPTGKYRFVTGTNRVNEWMVYGLGTASHPMHLHVHHFQVSVFCQPFILLLSFIHSMPAWPCVWYDVRSGNGLSYSSKCP
jgi:FtsP/CotA-like multicopper oxidase with cupredoxin domain